ncbi:TIGR03751 family conjugal transfer lipoprotein [Hyphococcus luteus]|nr:TIGR03751 family conjugal transfer lipoprotein [Marinicaulis flavus]
MPKPRTARRAALISAAALLAGCATNKDKVFDTANAPSMVEIYENHLARAGRPYSTSTKDADRRDVKPGHMTTIETAARNSHDYDRLVAWSRTQASETLNLFPTLPNPILVMYVHPHLAGEEGLPVPGYATAFTLYEKTHFALPGETRFVEPAPAATPSLAPGDDRLINAEFAPGE